MKSQESLVYLAINDPQNNWLNDKRLTSIDIKLVTDSKKLIDMLESKSPQVVIFETELQGFSLLSLIPWIQNLDDFIKIIVILPKGDTPIETLLLKQGVFDVLSHGDHFDEKIIQSLQRALQASQLASQLESFGDVNQCDALIGKSGVMLAIYEMIRNVAPTDSSVLITGESGTGKELIAKSIHKNSLRSKNAFIVVNCAAIPENLIESELFGYKAGAFTGASKDQIGLFQAAHHGSLFLDEIGDIPLSIQAKLLRVLQEGEIKRLGDHNNTSVDVRILAATHRDLSTLVQKGLFREDLYYRLNVIQIHVPPLRDRADDIPLLANYFIRRFNQQSKGVKRFLGADITEVLKQYSWPGNIRELENVLERATVLGASSGQIGLKDLPQKMLDQGYYEINGDQTSVGELTYNEAKKRALHHFNRSYIIRTLEKAEGNISLASEMAGMDRSNFKKIIKKYLPKERQRGKLNNG